MSHSFHIPGWSPLATPHALGWAHDAEEAAKEQLLKAYEAGETQLAFRDPSLPLFTDDTRPLPDSFSLASMVDYPWDQSQVGSCFANAAPQAMQITTKVEIAAGGRFRAVELSRRFCWYYGRKLDGMLGRWADGGTVTNAVRAMSDYGCPAEADWPYKANHSWLEQKPPDSVVASAKENRVTEIADPGDDDAQRRAIFNGHPIDDGIWWPSGWDTAIGPDGRAGGIGWQGGYGHSLIRIGYATWNGQLWWQYLNSHGPIYHPLTAELSEGMVGYKPITGGSPDGKVFDFWVRADWLKTVQGYGNAECKIIAGVDGFKTNIVAWEDMLSWDDATS